MRSRTCFSIAATSGDWLLEGSKCALTSIDRVLTMQSFRKGVVKGEMCVSHRRRQLMLLENQWTAVSRPNGWKTCKSKEVDRNWHRFGADLGGFDTFVSKSSQKNLESVILYWKVLFIPEIWRNNGVLCLLVIARGLPGSLRFRDTW